MTETKEMLLRAAESEGLKVTSAQLSRWQQNGLLPAPKQMLLGRHGSKVDYPAGATNQLIALCRYLKVKRSFDAVRWRLWWDGFPIRTRYVRDGLKKVSSELSDFKHLYVNPRTGRLNEAGLSLKEQISTVRLKEHAVAQARGRVRKRNFGGVVESFVLLFFGPSSRTLEEPARQDGVDKALGLGKARSFHGQRFVIEEYLPQLKELLAAPDAFTFAEAAPENSLKAYRDLLRHLLTSPEMRPPLEVLTKTSLNMERLFGPDNVADADDYAFVLLFVPIVLRDVAVRQAELTKNPSRRM